MTAYSAFAPVQTTKADLGPGVGTRWTVEASRQTAHGAVGMDQYAVRSWRRFPPWQTVDAQLRRWRETGIWDKVWVGLAQPHPSG